jgi:hypothetical protein
VADISHIPGNDLLVDATGDIATSDGSQLGQERVLRRLFTNPGAYIWHLQYGAGLARFLGRPMAAARIRAVIQEPDVPRGRGRAASSPGHHRQARA